MFGSLYEQECMFFYGPQKYPHKKYAYRRIARKKNQKR